MHSSLQFKLYSSKVNLLLEPGGRIVTQCKKWSIYVKSCWENRAKGLRSALELDKMEVSGDLVKSSFQRNGNKYLSGEFGERMGGELSGDNAWWILL